VKSTGYEVYHYAVPSMIRLLPSPNIVKIIKSRSTGRAGHAACMEEMINALTILVKRPKQIRKDNICTDLRETGWDVDWMHMAQDRDQWRALV